MAPWLRSTLAVLSGLVVYIALWALGNYLCSRFLNVHADQPSKLYFATSLSYIYLGAFFGGYEAAAVARRRAILHGVVLALILLGVNVINLVNKGASIHEAYVLLVNLGGPLMVVAGAYLRGRGLWSHPHATAVRTT